MEYLKRRKWSKLSLAIFIGLIFFSIVIAVESCLKEQYWIALVFPVPTIVVAYLLLQRQPIRLPIQFAENQTDEVKRFITSFLIAHRRLLSRFINESKTVEFETALSESLNEVIQCIKMSVSNDHRQELLRTCLLNRDYVTKKFPMNSPGSNRLFWAAWFIGYIGLQMHDGASFQTALGTASAFVILGMPIIIFIMWKFFGRAMVRDTKELINRTVDYRLAKSSRTDPSTGSG